MAVAGEVTDLPGDDEERALLLARERDARARLAFLAEASNVLASSLDYHTTLASVARLAVPHIADWCAVDVVESDGQVHQLATAHVEPEKVELARELQRRFPYDPNGPTGVPQVLRSGKPELVAEIEDQFLVDLVPDEEILGILRDLGLKSSMVVPMVARGRTVGAITFVAAESGRRFGPDDLTLATDLAGRAALAVDNARLYAESQRVAAQQAAMMAQMVDGVAIADASGRIIYLNDAAVDMGGGVRGPGMSIEAYATLSRVLTVDGNPMPPEELPMAKALRSGETIVDARWRLVRSDGGSIVMEGSAAPVRGEDGKLLGAVSTFRDVTAQVSLAQQKDAFLAAAAHDLKTPLSTIKGLAQVIQRRLERSDVPGVERAIDGLATIDRAVVRMTRLIDELLDVTRSDMDRPLDLNLREVDLVALVREVIAEHEQGTDAHRVTLTTHVPELVGVWDAERLERVIGNLLSNAVKYSPGGGEVWVEIGSEPNCPSGWAVLSVTDQGMGIPADDLPHIYDRFYRASNVDHGIPGTGIGLAGVKQIVERLGGTIGAGSSPGDGTRFTIRLPREATARESAQGVIHGGENA